MGDYKTAIENVTKALTEMLKLAGMEIPETNLDVGTEGTKNGGQGGTGHIPPGGGTPSTTSGSGVLFSKTTLKGDNREYSGIHGKEFYSINGKYYAKEDVDAFFKDAETAMTAVIFAKLNEVKRNDFLHSRSSFGT